MSPCFKLLFGPVGIMKVLTSHFTVSIKLINGSKVTLMIALESPQILSAIIA